MMKKQKNTFFNFRVRPEILALIKEATNQLGYTSIAEFIRTAIREKIKREANNG